MTKIPTRIRRIQIAVAALSVLLSAWMPKSMAATLEQNPVAALQARYTALSAELANNAFKRPLSLQSTETDHTLSGDLSGVLDVSFGAFGSGLSTAENWCAVLFLHLNTKYCRVAGGAQAVLTVYIGTKDYQELRDASHVDLAYRLVSNGADYMNVRMIAPKGPLGTSNYLIDLEAIPLGTGKTFMHLRYSYDYGLAARFAMQAYLATIGRGKVGFTKTGGTEAKASYIGGVRGVVERNTMRYFLAIESWLETPQIDQTDKRLHAWFATIGRYPVQLAEPDENAYMQMKHRELIRQQAKS